MSTENMGAVLLFTYLILNTEFKLYCTTYLKIGFNKGMSRQHYLTEKNATDAVLSIDND